MRCVPPPPPVHSVGQNQPTPAFLNTSVTVAPQSSHAQCCVGEGYQVLAIFCNQYRFVACHYWPRHAARYSRCLTVARCPFNKVFSYESLPVTWEIICLPRYLRTLPIGQRKRCLFGQNFPSFRLFHRSTGCGGPKPLLAFRHRHYKTPSLQGMYIISRQPTWGKYGLCILYFSIRSITVTL